MTEALTANQLFENNQNLVYSVCDSLLTINMQEVRMKLGGLSREDLIQEGFIGLWRASNTFDFSAGVEFSTYAYKTIKGYLLNCLNRCFNLKYSKNMTTKERLNCEKGILYINKTETDNDGSEYQVLNLLPVDSGMEERETSIDIKNAMNSLTNRERYIIYQIYYKERTSKDIGKELNITHQGVNYFRRRALKKMREALVDYRP